MEGRGRKTRKKADKKSLSSLRIGILITVLALIVVAAGVLMVPSLNITEVYCEGCVNTAPGDIIAAAQIKTGENIFLANIGKAGRSIKGNPLIEEVKIRRVFPNRICISVTERIPAAYVKQGSECVAIDKGGIVLEVIGDERVGIIIGQNTPKKPDTENTEQKEQEEQVEQGEQKEQEVAETEASEEPVSEEHKNIFPIPLIEGVEIEKAKVDAKAKGSNEESLAEVLEICNALYDAGLLNRTTYIDVTNTFEIKIVIENRLEVQIGSMENINYRAKFLAEVINTKISASENAILDYHGDDIYVRPVEDREDRVYKTEDEETEETEETDEEAETEETDGTEVEEDE